MVTRWSQTAQVSLFIFFYFQSVLYVAENFLYSDIFDKVLGIIELALKESPLAMVCT
jgi:hypothetical protein